MLGRRIRPGSNHIDVALSCLLPPPTALCPPSSHRRRRLIRCRAQTQTLPSYPLPSPHCPLAPTATLAGAVLTPRRHDRRPTTALGTRRPARRVCVCLCCAAAAASAAVTVAVAVAVAVAVSAPSPPPPPPSYCCGGCVGRLAVLGSRAPLTVTCESRQTRSFVHPLGAAWQPRLAIRSSPLR
jgi:hypothetical protein